MDKLVRQIRCPAMPSSSSTIQSTNDGANDGAHDGANDGANGGAHDGAHDNQFYPSLRERHSCAASAPISCNVEGNYQHLQPTYKASNVRNNKLRLQHPRSYPKVDEDTQLRIREDIRLHEDSQLRLHEDNQLRLHEDIRLHEDSFVLSALLIPPKYTTVREGDMYVPACTQVSNASTDCIGPSALDHHLDSNSDLLLEIIYSERASHVDCCKDKILISNILSHGETNNNGTSYFGGDVCPSGFYLDIAQHLGTNLAQHLDINSAHMLVCLRVSEGAKPIHSASRLLKFHICIGLAMSSATNFMASMFLIDQTPTLTPANEGVVYLLGYESEQSQVAGRNNPHYTTKIMLGLSLLECRLHSTVMYLVNCWVANKFCWQHLSLFASISSFTISRTFPAFQLRRSNVDTIKEILLHAWTFSACYQLLGIPFRSAILNEEVQASLVVSNLGCQLVLRLASIILVADCCFKALFATALSLVGFSYLVFSLTLQKTCKALRQKCFSYFCILIHHRFTRECENISRDIPRDRKDIWNVHLARFVQT